MDFGFSILDFGLTRRHTATWARRCAPIQNPKSKIQHRRGFALVDVILGGILLSIGLAAIISLATRSLKSQTDGEKQMTAAWLCDELLSLVVVDGPINYPRMHDTSGQFEFPFQDFAFDVDLVDQGADQPYIVTATVSWHAGRGVRSVQVQTMIADRRDDPDETRIPEEPIDREERWYGEEEESGGSGGSATPPPTGGANG
jgi:hypothetical protein